MPIVQIRKSLSCHLSKPSQRFKCKVVGLHIMLFPLTPENLTFLPLISPVASCSKISPHLLHIDSPGGGTLVDSYTHWHDPPAGYPGQSPPHP